MHRWALFIRPTPHFFAPSPLGPTCTLLSELFVSRPQCNGCSVLPFIAHQIKHPMHLHNKGTPVSLHDGHLLVHIGDLYVGCSLHS